MKKLGAVTAVLVLAAVAATGLASCGGGDETSSGGGGKGGILNATYASFPDYMDPALSYTAEGWTAMADVYIAAAHLQARQRRGRLRSHPRPGERTAEDQQRRQDLHPLPPSRPQILGRDPGQSLRLPLRGRTDDRAQLRRLALLPDDRRRRKVRRNETGPDPRNRNRRQNRRNRHQPRKTARHLRQRARPDVRRAAAAGHADRRPLGQPAARHRPVHDHQVAAGQKLGIQAQPLLGESQRQGDARPARRRDGRRQGHDRSATSSRRSTTSNRALTTGCRTRRRHRATRKSKKTSKAPSSGSSRRSAPTTSG